MCSRPRPTANSDCARHHCCCSQRALPADAQRSLTRQMSQLHSPSAGGQGASAGQPIDLTADDSPTSEGNPLLPVIEDRAPLLGISAGWQNGSVAGRQEEPGRASMAAQVQVDACLVWLCWSGLSVGRSADWVASRSWGSSVVQGQSDAWSGYLCWQGLTVGETVFQVASWGQQWQLGSTHSTSDSATAWLQVQVKQEGLTTQAGAAAVKLESVVPGQARGQAPRGPLPIAQPARCHCQSPCLQPHSCCCRACVLPYGCA